jgi:hypothetical protein
VRQAARLKYIPQSNVSNWLDKKTKHPKKFQLCRFPDVSATARKKENGNMFDVKLESVGRFFFSLKLLDIATLDGATLYN